MNNFQSTNLNDFNNSRFKGKGLGGSSFLLSKLVKNIAISFLLVMLSVAGIVGGFSLFPTSAGDGQAAIENVKAEEIAYTVYFYKGTGVSTVTLKTTYGYDGTYNTVTVTNGYTKDFYFYTSKSDYDSDNGSGADVLELSATTSSGYVIKGWYSQANGGGYCYSTSASCTLWASEEFDSTSTNYVYAYAVPGYSATVSIKRNGSSWSSSGIFLQLKQNGTTMYYANNITATSYTFNVASGTYDLFASKSLSAKTSYVDTGINISSSAKSPSVNYYTLEMRADDRGVSSFSGDSTYLSGQTVSISANVKSGYTFNSWQASGNTPTSTTSASTTVTITSKTQLTAYTNIIKYTISYTLNGGRVATANPPSYTVETATFTLNNPTKTGYTFAGWTGSNGTTAQTTVSIAKGSTGNKSYTANWTDNYNEYEVCLNFYKGTGVSAITVGGSPATDGGNWYFYYRAEKGSNTIIYNESFTVSATLYSGFTFSGWCKSSDGSGLFDSNATFTTNAATIAQDSDYTEGDIFNLYATANTHTAEFPTTWKTELQSLTTPITPSGITAIDFYTYDEFNTLSYKDDYTEAGRLSTGIIVMLDTTADNNVAFVWYETIYAPVDCSSLFRELTELVTITFSNFDTSNSTDMTDMISDCPNLGTVGIYDTQVFDTSNVESMSCMFGNCSNLENVGNLGWINTSKVTSMNDMFYGCSSLTSLNLSWNTQNVEDMASMFNGCTSLSSLTFISSTFVTTKVYDVYYMFENCSSLTNLDLSTFNMSNLSNNNNQSGMLSGCTGLKYIKSPSAIKSGISIALPTTTWYRADGKSTTTLVASSVSTDIAIGYQVTANANGGSVSSGTTGWTISGNNATGAARYSLDSNKNLVAPTLATLPTATRTGYTFNNWYNSTNGGTQYTTSYIFSADTTMYANWTANTATITIKQNGSAWSNSGMNVALYSGTTSKYAYSSASASGSTVKWTAVASGTYNVYAGKNSGAVSDLVDTGVDITVSSTGSATINYYVLTLNKGTGIASVTGAATYLSNQSASINASASAGYTWSKWTVDSGNTPSSATTANTTVSMSKATTLTANATANTATINIYKNDSAWSSSGMNVALYSGTTSKYAYSSASASGSTVKWTAVASGTYNVYAGKNSSNKTSLVDTGVDITVSSTGSATINYYDLTLNKGTGISSVSGNATYLSNQSASINASASTGYTWSKWTVTIGNTPSSATTANTTVSMSQTTTLTANATANTFTIAFNGNGNTSGSTASVTATYNKTVTLTANGFTKTGYMLTGWATSSTGTVVYVDGQTLTAAQVNSMYSSAGKGGTYTLYAHWERAGDIYFSADYLWYELLHSNYSELRYTNINNIVLHLSTDTIVDGNKYCVPAQPGKNYSYSTTNITSGNWNNSQINGYVVSSNTLHIYPYWGSSTSGNDFVLTFQNKIGNNSDSNTTGASPFSAFYSNYKVSIDLHGINTDYLEEVGYMFGAGVFEIKFFNKFNMANVTSGKDTMISSCSNLAYLAAPSNETSGITLPTPTGNKKWYITDSTSDNVFGSLNTTSTLTTAMGMVRTGYKTTYNLNGSGAKLNNTTGTVYQYHFVPMNTESIKAIIAGTSTLKVSLPTPTRAGYTFKGWYTDASGGTKVTDSDSITADRTLYAQWTANTATINIYKNGSAWSSSGINAALYSGTTVAYAYSSASASGSTVTWSAVASGTYNVYAGKNSGVVSALVDTGVDITVSSTGSATINYYTLEMRADDRGISSFSGAATYLSGQTASISANVKSGYKFNSWEANTGGNTPASTTSVSTTVTITSATQLTAYTNIITYTISYTLNGGTVATANPTSYTVETATFTLNNPTRAGYTFAGWTGSNGSTKQTTVTISSGSTGDKSYTANWTANTATVTIQQNGSAWSSSGMNVALYNSNGDVVYAYSSASASGAKVTWSAVVSGTYNVYAGKNSSNKTSLVDTGVDITVSNTGSATINYYVLTLNKGTGIASVTGAATYLSNQSASINASASAGYTWSKWTVDSGNTPSSATTANTTVSMSKATTLTANATQIDVYLPTGWKSELVSMKITGSDPDISDFKSIIFTTAVPSGYTYKNAFSTGIKVYASSSNSGNVAFVWEKKIKSPADSSSLFYEIYATLTFNNFNTSSATNMNSMFSYCHLNVLDISGFDVSNVTTMTNMFSDCTAKIIKTPTTIKSGLSTELPSGSNWYNSSNSKVTTFSTSTQNMTLAVGYLITADANGGSITSASSEWTIASNKLTATKVLKYSESNGNLVDPPAIGALPTATRTGYKFNNWYNSTNGGTQYTTSTVFSADTTMYANWIINSYTFTVVYQNFNGVNATNIVAINSTAGETVTRNSSNAITETGLAKSEYKTFTLNYSTTAQTIQLFTVSGNQYKISYSTSTTDAFDNNHRYSPYSLISSQSSYSIVSYKWTPSANQTIYVYVQQYFTLDHNGTLNGAGSDKYGTYATTSTSVTCPDAASTVLEYGADWTAVPYGSTYTSTQTAKSGYKFVAGTGSASTDPSAYVTTKTWSGTVTGNVGFNTAGSTLYNITFDSNGGSGTMSDQTGIVYMANETVKANAFTRTGYSFAGWALTSTGSVVVGNSGTINKTVLSTLAGTANESITLYAKWDRNSYQVLYDAVTNGGTYKAAEGYSSTSATIKYGDPIDLEKTHRWGEKSGWTFVGWNTNSNATTALSSLKMGTSKITLYAIYSKTLTGTFNYYNNQSTTVSVTIYNTATSGNITAPDALGTPSGYTFRHWSTSNAANASSSAAAKASITLTGNVTYYASYQKTVTATFYYCTLSASAYTYTNATANTAKATATQYIGYTGTIINSNFTVPTAVTGSTGGACAENYKGVATATNSATTVTPTTANTTFYAVYYEGLTFYYYNGSAHTSTAMERYMLYNGTSYNNSLSGTVPTPSAYDGASFTCWQCEIKAESSYTREPLGTGVNALYAKYTKSITGTFYYHNGTQGTSTTASQNRYYVSRSGGINTFNNNFTVPTAVATDRTISDVTYTYRGVSTSADANAEVATPTTANSTFYASYTYTVTVSFNGNNATSGTAPSNLTGTAYMKYDGSKLGVSLSVPSNPFKRTGYSLKTNPWNSNASGTGTDYAVKAYTFTASMTLYSNWTPNTDTAYKVEHYKQNLDGTNYTLADTDNLTGTTAGSTSAKAKTYTGFTAGTITQSTINADGSTVVRINYTRNTHTLTLTKGTGINSFTSSLTSANGLVSKNGQAYVVRYGASVPYSATASSGYQNIVYKNGSTTVSSPLTMPDSNVTITASASTITYTITYTLNGGTETTNPTSYTVETATFTLNNPTKTGYTFAGWTGTGLSSATKTVTISQGSTGNRTYTANWTANSYVLNFENTNLMTASRVGKYGAGDSTAGAGVSFNTSYSIDSNGNIILTRVFTGTNGATSGGIHHSPGSLTVGETYRWSVQIKVTSSTVTKMNIGQEQGGQKQVNITNDWQTITHTYTAIENQYVSFVFYLNSGSWSTGDKIEIKSFVLQQVTNTTLSDTAVASKMVTYNSTYGTLPTPTRTGYTFAGWYTAASGGTKIESTTTFANAGNQTLYAHWNIVTYTITYNLNGGTVAKANPETYTVETATFTLNNPTKTGYTFAGWTGSNGSTAQTSVSIAKGSTGNKSYTANWIATITLSATGATVQYGDSTTFTITYAGDGTLSATSADKNYVTTSLSSKTVTVNVIAYKSGTVAITVSATAGTNYAAPSDKTFTVTLAQREITITAKAQTITYGKSIATGTSQVSIGGKGLVSGDSLTEITLTPSTTNAGTGTITPSAATIKKSTTDVTSYYKISYNTGSLTINRATLATASAVTGLVYNGSEQTGVAGQYVTWTGTTKATNAGSYKATATPTSNYAWSDGTTTAKEISWSIAQAQVTISAKGNYATTASTKYYVTKTYDGNTTATVTKDTHYTVTSTGKVPTLNISAVYANANVGERVVTITATLSDTTNYEFTSDGNTCQVNGKITAKAISGTVTVPSSDVTYGNTISLTYSGSETVTYFWQWSADNSTWTNCAIHHTSKDFMITSTRVGQNVVVGKYLRVAITGSGNYSGTKYSNATNAVIVLNSDIILTSDTITKVYDGNTSVKQTITAKLDKVYNLVAGDVGNAELSVTKTTYDNANVGTGKTVTVTVSGSGSKISNYSFSTTKTTTGAITNATLTVKADNYSAQYDGEAHGISVSATAVGGQTVTIKYGLTNGTYNQTSSPTWTDVTSAQTVYYQISAPNHTTVTGSKTVTITAKELTSTQITAHSVTWTGATTYARTINTGVGSENLSLTYTPYSTNVGTYTYATSSASGKYTLAKANGTGKASNYTISSAGDFTIKNATQTLTLSATSVADLVYGVQTTATITKTSGASIAVTYSTGGDTYVKGVVDSDKLYVVGLKAGGSSITITLTATLANYDNKTVTYTVTKTSARAISNAAITLGTTTYTYDGSAKTPTVTVKDNIYTASSYKATTTVTLVENTDYTKAYSNNTNAGTGTATVTGKGNYTGTKGADFTINKVTLSTPSGLAWSTSSRGTATWSEVSGIGSATVSYSVQLYKGSTAQGSAVAVSKTSYDFASVIRSAGAGTYTFKVTAISSNTSNVNNSAQSGASDNLYAVSVTVSAGTGIASVYINASGTTSYVMINGESKNISASASTGYTFTSWSSGSTLATIGSTSKASTTVTYSASATNTTAITLTATATINTYTLTINYSGAKVTTATGLTVAQADSTVSNSGSISAVNGSLTVKHTYSTTELTVTINASTSGKKFVITTGDYATGGKASNFAFNTFTYNWTPNANGNKTINVYVTEYFFIDLNGALNGKETANISGYGTANVSINGASVQTNVTDYCIAWPKGTTYSITVTPNTNYVISKDNTKANFSTSAVTYENTTGMTAPVYPYPYINSTYNIVFNGNTNTGGSTATMSGVIYGFDYTLTANGFTKTGYTFSKWNTAENGSGTAYENEATVKNLSSTAGATINLYAQWTINQYTLTINPNGGSYEGSTANKTVTQNYATTYSVANPTRDGYIFTGWTLSGSGSMGIASIASGNLTNSKVQDTNGTYYYQLGYSQTNTQVNVPTWSSRSIEFMRTDIGDYVGQNLVLEFDINITKMQNAYISVRFAAAANDWGSTGNINYSIYNITDGWAHIVLTRAFQSSYSSNVTTPSGTATVQPNLQFYIYYNDGVESTTQVTRAIDFAVRNIGITVESTGKTFQATNVFTFGAGNSTLTANWVEAVAKVEFGGRESYFTTLESAMTYANSLASSSSARAVVTLLKDYTATSKMTISSGKYITLKADSGVTLTRGVSDNLFVNSGDFIISNSTENTNLTINGNNIAASLIINAGTLTINNGTFLGNADSVATNNPGYYGGCINSTGTITINNGTFKYFSADNGGVVCIESDTAITTINGGLFTENKANSYAGVIDCYGTVNITGGTFTNNSATNGGGAISHGSGTVNISGGSFTNNSAASGGAIIIKNGTISGDTVISNNTATNFGGGVYIWYISGGNVTLSSGTISGNTATNGGGVCVEVRDSNKASFTMTGGTISGNTASNQGSQIYSAGKLNLYGGNISSSSTTGYAVYSTGTLVIGKEGETTGVNIGTLGARSYTGVYTSGTCTMYCGNIYTSEGNGLLTYGTTTINGGTIDFYKASLNKNVLGVYGGTTVVNGGNFTNGGTTGETTGRYGNAIFVKAGATATINGGTFAGGWYSYIEGTLNINNGTLSTVAPRGNGVVNVYGGNISYIAWQFNNTGTVNLYADATIGYFRFGDNDKGVGTNVNLNVKGALSKTYSVVLSNDYTTYFVNTTNALVTYDEGLTPNASNFTVSGYSIETGSQRNSTLSVDTYNNKCLYVVGNITATVGEDGYYYQKNETYSSANDYTSVVQSARVGKPTITASGTTATSRSVPYGTSVTYTAPAVTGYTFRGWYSSNTTFDSTTFVSSSNGYTFHLTETTTLYALYSINWYTVSLTAGTGISAVSGAGTFVYNSSVTINATVKNGYTWSKWTQTSGGAQVTTTQKYTFNMPASNLNYTAIATLNTYTISYTLNGGSVATANPTSYTVETATFTLNNPTKTGYTFAGWTGSNGTTPQTTVTIEKGSTGNKNYTANWTANKFTIAFNGNSSTGGSTASVTATYDSTATLTSNGFTKTGYTFSGWATTASGAVAYSNGATLTAAQVNTMYSTSGVGKDGTYTLYAKWVDSTPPVIERCAYEINSDRTGYYVYAYATDNEAVNRVQFPTWTAKNGQDDIQKDWVNSATASGVKGEYSYNGDTYNYKFTVLVSDHNNEYGTYRTHIYAYDNAGNRSNCKPCENICFTWTITYDYAGGTKGATNPASYQSYEEDKTYTVSNPTRTGYTFAGWSSNVTGITADKSTELITVVAEVHKDVTLTATWTQNDVTFPRTWQNELQNIDYSGMTTTINPATITSIKFKTSATSGYLKIGTLSTGIEVYVNGKNVEFVWAKTINAPKDCSYLFSNTDEAKRLTAINSITFDNFKTNSVANMGSMFEGCSGLTTLDVSKFVTTNVQYMYNMFNGCSSASTIDVSKFVTTNVVYMNSMFYGCSALTTIDVSEFDTTNVQYMQNMFNGCNALTTLDVSGFVTGKVTNMFAMFGECRILTTLDVSGFVTTNVTNMAWMFSGCRALTNLDVSGFVTTSVKEMAGMFNVCSGLTTLDVSKFDTSKVTNMRYMFNSCNKLTSLDVSGFVTTSCTNVDYMFSYCSGLTSLDLSSFDMTGVTTYGNMLTNCSGLKVIKLPEAINGEITIGLPTSNGTWYLNDNTTSEKLVATSGTNTAVAIGYVITANANSGSITQTTGWTGTGNTATSIVKYSLDNTNALLSPTLATMPEATRTGYTLSGWYSTTNGGDNYTTTTPFTSNTTIYANWDANSYLVTVYYYKTTDSGAVFTKYSVSHNYGETISITDAGAPTVGSRTPYNTYGWTTTPFAETTTTAPSGNNFISGTNLEFTLGASDITYYQVFKFELALCYYRNPKSPYSGDRYNPSRQAFYTSINEAKAENSNTTELKVTQGAQATFTANYLKDAGLTYTDDSGSVWTLIGWNTYAAGTSGNFTTEVTLSDTSYNWTGNYKDSTWSYAKGVHAVWQREITQTLVYDKNGKTNASSVSNTSASGLQNANYTLSTKTSPTITVNIAGAMTDKAYTFTGWNSLANGSGTSYTAGGTGSFTISEDTTTTLYAQWSAKTFATKGSVSPLTAALKIKASGNGISDVTLNSTAQQLTYNSTYTVTVTQDNYYQVKSLVYEYKDAYTGVTNTETLTTTKNGEIVTTTFVVKGEGTIKLTAELKSYKLTINLDYSDISSTSLLKDVIGATIITDKVGTISGDTITYDTIYGETVKLNIMPETGFIINSITLTDSKNTNLAIIVGDDSNIQRVISGTTTINVKLSVSTWLDSVTANSFHSGTGTENNPYVIRTNEQLALLSKLVFNGTGSYASASYRIDLQEGEVLDLSKANWYPIGTSFTTKTGTVVTRAFTGSFVGDYYEIQNLTIPAGNNVGLFGISSGTISSVKLENVSIKGGYEVGGIVGNNSGTVQNSSVESGSIKGYCQKLESQDFINSVGGIAGSNSGSLLQVYSHANVSGSASSMGGIVGYNSGIIKNAYVSNIAVANSLKNTASDNPNAATGGIAGRNAGTITNVYVASTSQNAITSIVDRNISSYLGAIAGNIADTTKIVNAYYTPSIVSGDANTYGTSKAYSDMKTTSFLTSLNDASVWVIESTENDGLPTFKKVYSFKGTLVISNTGSTYIIVHISSSEYETTKLIKSGSSITISDLKVGDYTVSISTKSGNKFSATASGTNKEGTTISSSYELLSLGNGASQYENVTVSVVTSSNGSTGFYA